MSVLLWMCAYAFVVLFILLSEEAMDYLLQIIGNSKYQTEQKSDGTAIRLASASTKSKEDSDYSDSSVEEEEVKLSTAEDKSSCCLR